MGSLASEYKAKVNRAGRPAAYAEAEKDLWSYNKLINPKFFNLNYSLSYGENG